MQLAVGTRVRVRQGERHMPDRLIGLCGEISSHSSYVYKVRLDDKGGLFFFYEDEIEEIDKLSFDSESEWNMCSVCADSTTTNRVIHRCGHANAMCCNCKSTGKSLVCTTCSYSGSDTYIICNICHAKVFRRYLDMHLKVHTYNGNRI